ncbi:hypothetical protein DV738_g3955, partial [Chaetothyriales sp. CBS 135597]
MASGRSRDGRDKDHVYCFVPGEGIDVVVLATYLKRWIDGTATIEPSRHPRNRDVLGFNVGASSTLSREALKDLRDDSAKWQEEQNTRDFQRSPYDYVESDTFAERKKRGPTPHDDTQLRLAKPRTRPSQPESYGRSAREETQRKNADVGSDKPPDYNQKVRKAPDARIGKRELPSLKCPAAVASFNPSTSTNLSLYGWHAWAALGLESMDSTDRLSLSHIAPQPLIPSGRDASRTTEGPKQAEWEAHKEEIRVLYQHYPLKQVKQILEERGFVATQRMFKSRLSQWGCVKNSSDKEYQVAMLLLEERKESGKQDTVFVINGHSRSVKDLRKYIKGRKMTDEQFTQLARQNEAAGDLHEVHDHVRCGTPDSDLSEMEAQQSPTSALSQTDSPRPLMNLSQPVRTSLPPSPESCLLPLDRPPGFSLNPIQVPHSSPDTHRGRRNSIKIRKNRLSDSSIHRMTSISQTAPGGGQMAMEGVEKSFTPPSSMPEASQPFFTPRHSPGCDHFCLEDVDMLASSAVHSNPLPGTFGVDNQDALKLLNPPLSKTASGANLTCENCNPPNASHFSSPEQIYDSWSTTSSSRPVSSHQSPRLILNPSDDMPLDAFQVAPSSKDHDYCSRWASLCFLTCIYSTKHEASPDDIQAEKLAQKALADADREFEVILHSEDPMIVLALNNTLTILHQHNQSKICERIMKNTAAVAERILGVYSPIGTLTRYLGYAANPRKLLEQREITSSSQDKFRESASVLQQCYRLSCLRLSMEQQGDIPAAISYAETAINDSSLSLGIQHPKRLELMRNLALSYFHVGRDKEAEELYWKVLEGRANMLGRDHEYTHAIAYDLQEYLMKHNRWEDGKGEATPEKVRLEDIFEWDVIDPESADESAYTPRKVAQTLNAY